MSLLYVKEHTTCYNYETGNTPVVGKYQFDNPQLWSFTTIKNKILYLPKGKYIFSYGKYRNKELSAGQMIVIPAGVTIKGMVEESTVAYILRLKDVRNLCECFSLDMLLKEEKATDGQDGFFALNTDPKILSFFNLWDTFISDGLLCKYYLSLKIKELFYYLRAYHLKEDLLKFFTPILSNDLTFSDFVLRNHMKVKTVNELAAMANYSLSGFQKRFKKVFGVSAYSWMKSEKQKAIFYDINNSTMSLKEISDKFGFSSPSHFNDFCKMYFGHTPGVLRKEKIDAQITKK